MPAVEMKVLVAQSQSLQITEPTALQQGHKMFCDKVFFTVHKKATSPSPVSLSCIQQWSQVPSVGSNQM